MRDGVGRVLDAGSTAIREATEGWSANVRDRISDEAQSNCDQRGCNKRTIRDSIHDKQTPNRPCIAVTIKATNKRS